MNHLLLAGRLVKNPTLIKTEANKYCYITVAVSRGYKNSNGQYETDFINCTVWNMVAERVCEYCQKGDTIAIKGHIINNNYIDKDENPVYKYEIVADQISFLAASKKPADNEKDKSEEVSSENVEE